MIDPKRKIKTLDELEDIVDKYRDEMTFVTTNGCYDILHPGHIHSLIEAKKQGNVLIVGVNSDRYLKKVKSEHRPVMQAQDRAYVLASLSMVDYVTIFNENTPNVILERLKPHIHVKSRLGYNGSEDKVLKKHKIKLHLIDDIMGYSSSYYIERAGIIFVKDYMNKEL
jgi:glycerol-3-phosphate cytidylyltransferase